MLRSRIIYIACLLACVVAFFMTDTAVALLALVVLVILGAVMYLSVIVDTAGVKVNSQLISSCHVGDPASLELELSNNFTFFGGFMDIEYRAKNRVFGVQEPLVRRYIAPFTRNIHCSIPGTNEKFGRVDVVVERIVFRDGLGLFERSIKLNNVHTVAVLPKIYDPAIAFVRAPRARSGGDMFDKHHRGDDVSEVFDIRDYQPGDTPQTIHWKLSSKLDRLMTKEFSDPTDYSLALVGEASLCGLDGSTFDASIVNGIASVLTSTCTALIESNVPHDVVVNDVSGIHFNTLETRDDYADLLEMELSRPLSVEHPGLCDRLREVRLQRGFTKIILVTGTYDEESWNKLSSDVDLTVFFITEGAISSGITPFGYTVVSLDPSELATKFNRVEI